jgi:peptidoglycan/LPS O-acetylase OafA/YrhL
LLAKRYLKLIFPYVAAVLLSIVCAAIARSLSDHDSIPDPPTLGQMVAHIVLLQNILDFDSLSAGLWYIAIDFQLFALLLGLLWLARLATPDNAGLSAAGIVFIGGLALASLLGFNRDPLWDNWGLYFFGAYALGALVYWATRPEQDPDWMLLMALVVVGTLIVDFRSRIALALVTALALGVARHWQFIESRPKNELLAYLGKISYSVFLVHFPVILVINAVFAKVAPASPAINAFGILCAWSASTAVGALFYHCIELRSGRWQGLALSAVFERLSPAPRTKS